MIVVVNAGLGNVRSVQNMLRKAGGDAVLSNKVEDIRKAERLVLPGVGHFGHGMNVLEKAGLIEHLRWFALEVQRPVLGICLGAQLFGYGSEEAPGVAGLGWLPMYCRRFPKMHGLRVPRMGWGSITTLRQCPLLDDDLVDRRYYFVHSYYMNCEEKELVIAKTHYGIEYTCMVQYENIIGTQFHPEKSHRFGLSIMKAFLRL